MKSLKFDQMLVSLVMSGEKTSTWRVFDDKDLQVGDDLSLINKQTGQEFAQAKIISARVKRLSEVNDQDYEEGHERYENNQAMIDDFRRFYGDKVTGETVVKLIKFELK